MLGNSLPASRTTQDTSSERPPKYSTAGRGPGMVGVISQPERRVPSLARKTTGRVRWPLLRGLFTSRSSVGLKTRRRWLAATAAVSPSHSMLAKPVIPAAIFFDISMTDSLRQPLSFVLCDASHCWAGHAKRVKKLF